MKFIYLSIVFSFLIIFSSCGKTHDTIDLKATCVFNQVYGECTLVNTLSKSVRCRFSSEARTLHNFPIYSFQNVFLYPGMYAWSYARSINPWGDPIVSMVSDVKCSDR